MADFRFASKSGALQSWYSSTFEHRRKRCYTSGISATGRKATACKKRTLDGSDAKRAAIGIFTWSVVVSVPKEALSWEGLSELRNIVLEIPSDRVTDSHLSD